MVAQREDAVLLTPETVSILRLFLDGALQLAALSEWIAAYDWDSEYPQEREVVGLLELLVTEIGEGLREEDELRAAVVETLKALGSGRLPTTSYCDLIWFPYNFMTSSDTYSYSYGATVLSPLFEAPVRSQQLSLLDVVPSRASALSGQSTTSRDLPEFETISASG